MPDIPSIIGKLLIKVLLTLEFEEVRIKGSHHRLKHPDGRVTTIPVHSNRDLPKGLIRSIIKDDIGMEINDFLKLLNK